MPYSIEVKITEPFHPERTTWERMRPTGGDPYVWQTRHEAESMRRICYPEQTNDEVRVVEVQA